MIQWQLLAMIGTLSSPQSTHICFQYPAHTSPYFPGHLQQRGYEVPVAIFKLFLIIIKIRTKARRSLDTIFHYIVRYYHCAHIVTFRETNLISLI